MNKNAHHIQTMWNKLINIPSGIFIVDPACKMMHKDDKTVVLLYKEVSINLNEYLNLGAGRLQGSIYL